MDFKFRNRLASCVLGAVLLIGWGELSLADTQALQQAKESQAKGDLKSAIIHLKNTLQDNPDNGEARYLLGSIYVERGHWAGAEKELLRALQLGGSQALILAPLSKAFVKQGKFERLLEEIAPVSELAPTDLTVVYENRIAAWLALDKIENAAQELVELQQQAPEQASTYLSQARLAMKRGEWSQARESLQTLLDSEPKIGTAWSLLASLERITGELEKAETAYGKAITNRPDKTHDYLQRALVRIALEDYEGAEDDIQKGAAIAPNHPMGYYAKGLLQFKQGHYAEAQTAFEQVLNIDANHKETKFYLGVSHLAQEQYSQAEHRLRPLLIDSPQSVPVATLLATTYNKLAQPQKALDVLMPFLDQNEPNPQILALAGEAQLLKEDPAAAEEFYQRLAEQTPNNAELHTRIGLIQLASGKEAEAIESLAISAGNGFNYRAELPLAYYYLKTGQFDKALGVVNRLETHLPGNAGVLNLKGRVLMGSNSFAQARASFEQALSLKADLTSAQLRLAMIDLHENKKAAAKERYLSILERDKKNIAAMVGLAELAQQAGQESEYLEWLQRAAEANPATLTPRVYLANYHLEKGESDKALALARNLVDARPDNPEALALLGEIQHRSSDKQGALDTYTELTRLTPDSVPAQHRLASARAAMNQIEGARDALRKALELDPEHAPSIAAFSTLELRTGNHQQALELALRYQQLSPQSVAGFILEGDALMAAKRYTDAVPVYQNVLAQTADNGVAIKLHLARLRSGDEASADDALLDWIKNHPGDARLHGYLARSFLIRELDQLATTQLQELARLLPENASTFNNLAVLYQRSKDPRALETAEHAYQLEPDNPAFADTYGWILVEQGELTKGLELLRKATAAAPDNPELQYHLAYGLAEAGQTSQALQLTEKLQQVALSSALQNRVRQLIARLSSDTSVTPTGN
ncbi:PEP-CTERM system TPR-repeat protein PrsT [Motiliproteus coralliicola]|uniref:PEP-CTERM system TPR-repeat protein PrsT n=1 Tax=Motiliproteus coralliicola TaxID=2283196 RepID=A0A369WRR0_9GAMM|nr:XrtA/PEP-CTERM system TPR-repeat protein PrsT [Motiliproteus coralliicola]RDE24790.1 PEP-CTERM system TPR-repeat protein PrsT [Motiliproteus coralliicola]